MAIVSVTADNARIDAMESTAAISNIGGGAAAGTEPDFFYQGTLSISRKVSTAQRGFARDGSIPVDSADFTAARRKTWMAKILITNKDALDDQSVPGLELRLGSSSVDYHDYEPALLLGAPGLGDVYPIKGGWLIRPIDPNVATWRDNTTGTPVLTAVDWLAILGDFSVSSQVQNVMMDACDHGAGLNLVGGDGGDADGVWDDFVSHDEGTVGNRFGYVSTSEGILLCFGQLWIGQTNAQVITATVFNDSGKILVFPHALVDAGFSGISIDLGNATTEVDLISSTFIGRGFNNLKRFLDTELNVSSANDEITITGHGFLTGDPVLYSKEGGTEAIGLTDATEVYVERVSTDIISLHTTRLAAHQAGAPINLTASTAGNGENHSFRRQVDTRPDLTITGILGLFDSDKCTFRSFRQITLTSAATLTDTTLAGIFNIFLSTAILSGCSIEEAILAPGEAVVTTATLVNISDCVFTANSDRHIAGHAIEITAAGTYTYSDNTHTGYGPTNQSFGTTADVNGAAETITITDHPYTDGDPVYYNDEGGAVSIGLTDGNLYYLNSVDVNTVSVHLTRQAALNDVNRVDLTASGSESHSFYSAYAAIHNSSGGAVTINIGGTGDTPTFRNSGTGSTTTVNNTVTIEINGVTEGAQCSIHVDLGGGDSGTELMNEPADSAGKAQADFNFGGNQAVVARARSSGIVSATIADDGGVLTDETLAARDRSTINDITLFPASPVVNVDQYYFAGLTTFGELIVRIGTAGIGTYVLIWEYFNGTVWSTLTTTQADDFKSLDRNLIRFAKPGDWAATTVNSQGPYFYIRTRWVSGTMTTSPAGNNASVKVTKFIPFRQLNTIISTGLVITASWIEDVIA